jgi:RNA-directed DNA polymerase
MKRINNIFGKIISIENLELADMKARKNKEQSYGVQLHDKNRVNNILLLHNNLKNNTFNTSKYNIFTIHEPKERIIYRLPYYPDRILHHAIMNILEPIFIKNFTTDTFSCIKNRGINGCRIKLQKALRKDKKNTKYCLKIDIKKFYPSVNHSILKEKLRDKIKDKKVINILDNIIDSAPGIPIGNYLSQFFANFYLSSFDHYVKEILKVKYYYRYCDDMIFLSDNKKFLHNVLNNIREYLKELKLEIKENYQIFPVNSRSIDFIGFKFYQNHTLLRKKIKKNLIKKIIKLNKRKDITFKDYKSNISSWLGWTYYSNSINLLKKILKPEYKNEILLRRKTKCING